MSLEVLGSGSRSSRNLLCELQQNIKALPLKQTSLSLLGLLLVVGGVFFGFGSIFNNFVCLFVLVLILGCIWM